MVTQTDPDQAHGAAHVLRTARELFDNEPSWQEFYRLLLSADGLVQRQFPSAISRARFERTEEFAEIMAMLGKLRVGEERAASIPRRMITVRLAADLHEALKAEAHEHEQSLNWLCIQKLRQPLEV